MQVDEMRTRLAQTFALHTPIRHATVTQLSDCFIIHLGNGDKFRVTVEQIARAPHE